MSPPPPVSLPTGDYGPLPQIFFYGLAVWTVGSAFAVAAARNIVRAAVALLFALMGIAGFFFLLHAEFLAAVQLVVYVGGTLILMIFGIMLTSRSAGGYRPRRWEKIWALLVVTALAGPLIYLILHTDWALPGGPAPALPMVAASQPAVEDVGRALLDGRQFLIPFELLSMLLLAVMIGAAYLAKSRRPARMPPA